MEQIYSTITSTLSGGITTDLLTVISTFVVISLVMLGYRLLNHVLGIYADNRGWYDDGGDWEDDEGYDRQSDLHINGYDSEDGYDRYHDIKP